MSSRLALIALMTLSLAACDGAGLPGLGSQQEPQAEGHKGPPGVSPLEAPIETGATEARPIATADARTYNTTAFSARGNEPFWAVDAAGSTAIYKTPENQKGRAVRVKRLTFAEGVEYVGVLGGRPFVLTIRGSNCQDSMSGEKFPMSAELKVSGRTNRGCAAPATAEVASAVAATKAPAPAAPKPAAPKPAAPKPAAPAAAPAAAPVVTPTPAATETPAPAATETPAASTAVPEASSPATEAPTTVPELPMQLPSTPPTVPAAPAGDAAGDTAGTGE